MTIDSEFIPPDAEHNPYITILSPDYILNAEGMQTRRTKARPIRHPVIRFLEKIKVSESLFHNGTPCWEWQGCKSPTTGYGQFKIDGRDGAKRSSPHRFAYEYFIGVMPNDCETDHLCNVRHCASPLHLEAVTRAENMTRKSNRQIRCKNGHEFTEENTGRNPNGARVCRTCRNQRMRDFYARNPGYEQIKQFPCRRKLKA